MEDRWAKLEEIVRKVVREEIQAAKRQKKIESEAKTVLKEMPTGNTQGLPPLGERRKACGYCEANATGTVSGIPCCARHVHDAMDAKPRRMLGIEPKPVAGRD